MLKTLQAKQVPRVDLPGWNTWADLPAQGLSVTNLRKTPRPLEPGTNPAILQAHRTQGPEEPEEVEEQGSSNCVRCWARLTALGAGQATSHTWPDRGNEGFFPTLIHNMPSRGQRWWRGYNGGGGVLML